MVPVVHHDSSKQQQRCARIRAFWRVARAPGLAATSSPATSASAAAAVGRDLRGRLGQLATQLQQLVRHVLPAASLVARAELHAAAASQLEHRQHAAAGPQSAPKNREIADVALRQTLAVTTRTVRNAFWDLAYAIASLACSGSRSTSRRSRFATRARASRSAPRRRSTSSRPKPKSRDAQEAVIVAQGQIATAEDTLRALVFDPACRTSGPSGSSRPSCRRSSRSTVDVDGAVRNALESRTDLEQARKSIEANDINIRFFRNQTLPDVTANSTTACRAWAARSSWSAASAHSGLEQETSSAARNGAS